MATGDVVVRLSELGLAPPSRLPMPAEQVAAAKDAAAEAEESRRKRLIAREAARQAEKPEPDPWDAWRTQKAPEMFEAEVTHRG